MPAARPGRRIDDGPLAESVEGEQPAAQRPARPADVPAAQAVLADLVAHVRGSCARQAAFGGSADALEGRIHSNARSASRRLTSSTTAESTM